LWKGNILKSFSFELYVERLEFGLSDYRFFAWIKEARKMLSSGQNPEECDATAVDSSNAAGIQNI